MIVEKVRVPDLGENTYPCRDIIAPPTTNEKADWDGSRVGSW